MEDKNAIKTHPLEVQKELRKELLDFSAYLPQTYSAIIYERLDQKYPRALIRKTKSGQANVTPILRELVKLAKEEHAETKEALN
jgi:hypothetical protein